jgi:hypothetical protein
VLQLQPIQALCEVLSISLEATEQYQARVHHTTIDDIFEGEPVTVGMFSINNHPAAILFDYGSCHSFIS